jgi:AraC-like DNA-binding protein
VAEAAAVDDRRAFHGGPPARELRGEAGLRELAVQFRVESRPPAAFRAWVRTAELGEVRFADLRLVQSIRVEREAGPRADDDLLLLNLRRGAVRLESDTFAGELVEGAVFVLPASAPVVAEVRGDSRLFILRLPSRTLGIGGGDVQLPVGGGPVGAGPVAPGVLTGMLTSALRQLAAGMPPTGTSTSELVGQCLANIARAMLSDGGAQGDAGPVDAAVRARLHRIIEQELHNPSLGMGLLARRMGMSTRNLYKLFEGEPRTLVQHIRELRVRELADLLAVSDAPLTTLALATGFGSVDSAQRAFREVLGCTPRDLRLGRRRQAP